MLGLRQRSARRRSQRRPTDGSVLERVPRSSPSAERSSVVRIVVPAPRGSEPRNAWLIPGPPLVLVDPGPATDAAYAAVRDAMAALSLGLHDIRRIVLTHAHGGHAGLTARIQADSGARILAHPDALPALADPSAAAAQRVERALRAAGAAGMPADLAASSADEWRARLAAELAEEPLGVSPSACAALADGEPLDPRADDPEGMLSWSAHHTGGHSADHLVLVHTQRATAITGDLIDRRRSTIADIVPTGPGGVRAPQLARLVEAWRILARRPVNLWLPGHGEPIRAPRVLIARRLAESRLALQSVRHVLSAEPLTAWEVCTRRGMAGGAHDAGRALTATIALLDWLVARGHAARTVRDGAWRFVRTERRGRGR